MQNVLQAYKTFLSLHLIVLFFRELLTNVLDMVSVLISVVSNAEGTHGQSAEESRKAAFALFKKLKVYDCFKAVQVRSIFIFQRSFTI